MYVWEGVRVGKKDKRRKREAYSKREVRDVFSRGRIEGRGKMKRQKHKPLLEDV